ncbi:MAG: BspA family leucine-rich repeat surface protein [Prevotella sp.]|nr:BspA family leucine-rich repeat surface protein [Prevotella sp.]
MKQRILTTLLALVTIALYASAQTKEAYAWLDKGTLKFYYDNQRSSRQGTTFDIPWVEQGYSDLPGWSGDARVIRVEFHSLGEYPEPFWAPMMFYNMPNLEYIGNNGQYGLATLSNINFTYMRGMFWNCPNLKGVDGFKYLNTTNVKDLGEMFDGCESLESVDLTNLPSTFNTSLVTDMDYMFADCKQLTTLDLSGFNTTKLTTTYDMFNGCSNLETIFCSNNWKKSNMGSSTDMFTGCTKLKGGVDFSPYNSNDINFANPTTGYFTDRSQLQPYAWIENGNLLWICYDTKRTTRQGTTYDIPWTSSLYPDWTFNNAITSVAVDKSFVNYREPLDGSYMFYNMSNLNYMELDNFYKCNFTNMSHMFDGCSSLPMLNAQYINTANVTDMSYMFYNCSSLPYLFLNLSGDEYADCFNTSNVTNMESMFEGCSSVRFINMAKFNTAKVTNMKNMFKGCGNSSETTGLTSLSVSSFNTDKVIDMTGMFSNCTKLKTIYASDEWSTARVTSSANMFEDCTSLRGGQGTTYMPSNVDKTYARIDGGNSSPGYFSQALLVDENNFPDAKFREWVASQSFGEDGVLTPDELLSVKTISIGNKGIYDLTGIEYFTAIESLYCQNNKLMSLDLSENRALTILHCYKNWLTALDVSSCTHLKTLHCYNNQLNVAAMGALVESLPRVEGDPGEFKAQNYSSGANEGNSMTVAQRDAVIAKNWTVKSSSGSTTFQLLLRIDEASFPDPNFREWVIELDQQKNFDGMLSAEEISGVISMDVSGMGISDLTGIENFFLITTLDCSQNQLTHLDLTSNTNLRTLYCYSNQLKLVNMKKLFESLPTITNGSGELRLLDCDDENEGNDLTKVSFQPVIDKGWEVKNCINGQWMTQTSTMKDTDLWITKALFPDDNFRAWLFTQTYGQDGKLTAEEISKIYSMNVSGLGITDLRGIEVFTALESLNCSKNNLSSESVEYLINALPYSYISGITFMLAVEALVASEILFLNVPFILEYYDNDINVAKAAIFDAFLNSMCKKLNIVDNRDEDEGNVVSYAAQQLALSRGWILREYSENSSDKWKPIDVCVEINEENFPDQNFRNWLLRQSYGSDGKLYTSEINRVFSIDLHSENIQNLKGIEHFTVLENLYCHRNQIKGDNMLDLMFLLTTDTRMQIIRDIILGMGSYATGDFNRNLYVLSPDYDDEKNVCDKACVRIAKERGWKVFCLNNNAWTEYAGSENTGSGLKGDMNNDNKLTITDAVIIVDTILEKE